MKLLILEGCDKVGKSTTAEEVKRGLVARGMNAKVTHWGKPAPMDSRSQNYMRWMNEINLDLTSEYDVIIWDRSFVGNHIYGQLYQDQPALNFNEMMELMNYIYNNLTFHIDLCLLQSDYATLEKRFVDEKEEYVPTEDITYLQFKYKNLFEYIKAVSDCMPWPEMTTLLFQPNEATEDIVGALLLNYFGNDTV